MQEMTQQMEQLKFQIGQQRPALHTHACLAATDSALGAGQLEEQNSKMRQLRGQLPDADSSPLPASAAEAQARDWF